MFPGHWQICQLKLGGTPKFTGVIQGGTGGDDPPQNFGWGDDIAHIPPNKLSPQLRKITICLDNRMKCNFYRLLQRNEKEVIAF